jgi:hypothetical protein
MVIQSELIWRAALGEVVGSELQRKDEREISINVEVGTGALLPGGKIALGFKRAWQKRGENYLRSVSAIAECSPDDVIDVVAQGGAFTDVFGDGIEAIVKHSDEAYSNTFAHFVACALNDPAKVDVSAFLIERFCELRPPHIRLFWSICESAVALYSAKLPQDAQDHDPLLKNTTRIPRNANGLPPESVQATTMESIVRDCGLPSEIAAALLADLTSRGIIINDSNGIGVAALGILAYKTVRPVGVSSILADVRAKG